MAPLTMSEIAARLDPELADGIDGFLPPHLPDGELTVDLVRGLDETLAVRGTESADSVHIERADGSALELRLHHQPASQAILWIHGGGMFLGSARFDDAFARELSETLGVSVASVDYRLAPEHPHPEPLEDCYAALEWVADRYDRVVVAGGSAGGGLAAALALLARDRSGPAIAGVQLFYPMLDDRGETASAKELADTAVWNRRLHDLAWSAYLGGTSANQYAAPARASDLSGLPPHYLDVGDLDLFLDEDVAYAGALGAAGVAVELYVESGAVHAFERVNPDAAVSRRAIARRLRWLATRLEVNP